MKNLLLLVCFVFLGTFVSAQSCAKTCCSSKKASASVSAVDMNKVSVEADALVSASQGALTKRSCEISGTTAYYEKSVCNTSGKVSWAEVQYDSKAKKFTRVASASMEVDEKGNKVEAKACAGKSEGKACCKKEGAKACAGKEGSK